MGKVRAVALAVALVLAGTGAGASAGAAATASQRAAFAVSDSYRVGSWPASVVVGDFSGDGRQDAVVSTGFYFDPANDNKLFLFRQTPTGGFHPPVRLATDGQAGAEGKAEDMAMAAGDLDGDGRTDLALATLKGVDVFLQRNGTLSLDRLIELPGARQVSVTDLDADGRADLLVNSDGGLVALTGTTGGAFAAPARLGSVHYTEVETGDVTGDGRVDIVGVRSGHVDVLAGQAGGTFAPPVLYVLHDYTRMNGGLAIGDFNGDGRNDVAASVSMNRPGAMIDVLTQNANGTLTRTDGLRSYDIPEPLAAADMNLDGRTDLVTLHGGWMRAGIYPQAPDGTMGEEELWVVPYASRYLPTGLAVGDFSGDGMPDIAVADYNHGLVVLRSATYVRSWGYGNYGQLGTGSTAGSPAPSPPLAPDDISMASAGAYHNLALGRDGRVWSWGLNHAGQLGNGTTTDRSSPAPVPGLTRMVSVGTGAFHSLGVKNDGTVWAWGWNAYGQLGTGSTADRPLPVQLPGISNAVAVAGGATHSVGLTADGSVWSWGLNHVGQLGTGDTKDSLVPVRVLGPQKVVAVAAGLYHTSRSLATGSSGPGATTTWASWAPDPRPSTTPSPGPSPTSTP